jgi:hypothetical protein
MQDMGIQRKVGGVRRDSIMKSLEEDYPVWK